MDGGLDQHVLLRAGGRRRSQRSVEQVGYAGNKEGRQPLGSIRLVAPLHKPLMPPGISPQEEIQRIEGNAGRLIHQDRPDAAPQVIVAINAEVGSRRADVAEDSKAHEQLRSRNGNSLTLLERWHDFAEQEQGDVEISQHPQEPVLHMAEAWAKDKQLEEIIIDIIHRYAAAGKHDVGHRRCQQDNACYPGQDNAQKLAFPELCPGLPGQGHDAEIAGDEEHHRHDEDVRPEHEQGKGKLRISLVHRVPPFRCISHVAHGCVEDNHQADDKCLEIVQKEDTPFLFQCYTP